jgi:cobalt-zinc-cadmium efflux system protein
MFTDAMALAIAIAAIRLSRMPADRKRTFGYYRFEVLAAALNAVLLFLVALYILYEAYTRWVAPRPIETLGMLAIAVTGLVVNLVGMRLLAADAERNLNVKGAYLEVWADALGSLGVIAGALVVWFTARA